MKLEHTQLKKLQVIWRDTHDTGSLEHYQAVIDLYESEMRPKDAAPVIWRRINNEGTYPLIAEIFTNGTTVARDVRIGDTHFLTEEDLMLLPRKTVPADPTPEEKADAEFEAYWLSSPPITLEHGYHAVAKAAFMAAKFPAEGGGK